MLPFGNTPFGRGYFGRGDWGTRAFWENVPIEHQLRDVDGDLEGLLTAWGDEYDAIREDCRDMPQQRDPWQARETDDGEWMFVTSCVRETDDVYGEVVKLIEEPDETLFPPGTTGADWLPYTAIHQVGRTWRALVAGGEWPVVNVRTRNVDDAAHYDASYSLGNEVWCTKADVLPFYHEDEVVAIGNGLATIDVELPIAAWIDPFYFCNVTGSVSGILSISDDGLGNLSIGGFGVGTVDYATGSCHIDLTSLGTGDVIVLGSDVLVSYTVIGYYIRLRPVPMLQYLYGDFGVQPDRDVPEWVQRAALIHYHQYMGQKGSTPAYEILGKIYLFDVTATGLWSVCDPAQLASYPAGHEFTTGVPPQYFTDIDPRRIRFDDIAADVLYYDWIGDHNGGVPGYVTLVDNEIIYDDGTVLPAGDTWSLAKGFAVDITQGYYHPLRVPCTVDSVTALSALDLATYGLPFGYRIVINMTADQRADFNFTGKGRYALTEYDLAGLVPPSFTSDAWWIDAEEGFGAGQWTVIVGAQTTPTVGSDIALRYWPGIDTTDCCYCRSSYVRFRVLPTAAALAFWGSYDVAGSRLYRARARLEARIQRLLMPQHVRVLEFAHT
jgi:hypothetical protein